MKFVLASDHAGYKLKKFVGQLLQDKGHEVIDVGCDNLEPCDYPDYGRPAAEMVARGEVDRGVLICGTGMGMTMTANRIKGVRAALCFDLYGAQMCRKHNNANILVLAGGMTGERLAAAILDDFINTGFEGGRHIRRVEKIDGDKS